MITFDNGYPARVTFASDLLSRHGCPGVLFELAEEHCGRRNAPVLRLGWEVDSRSATCPDLTEEAGYVAAVTENAGYAPRGVLHDLDRHPIEGGGGVEGLAADLESDA